MVGTKFRGLMRKVACTGCRQLFGRSRRNDSLSNIDENLPNIYEGEIEPVVGIGREQCIEREERAHSSAYEDRVENIVEARGDQAVEAEVDVQEANDALEIGEHKADGAGQKI